MAKAVADVNKELQGGFTSNDGESKDEDIKHCGTVACCTNKGHS